MKKFTKQITNKALFEYTRWILIALMMLVGTSSAWAWGWVVRCVDLQSSENPTYYLGDEATFYWCFNGDGSNASFKRACISTSSSSAGTWMDNLEWVKDGCDGNDNKTWKASFLLSSTGTKYYGLWLGWGNSVGDNGRYYNGSGTWYDGDQSYSSSKFTVNALPNPTNPEGSGAGTSATLSWTRNATYTTVMIVRYIKGATVTAPAQGTSYTAGTSKLGTGTVVYKGTGSSFDDTGLTAGNSYTYYFYTLNNNYYSSGVSADISTCTPPDAPFRGVAQSEDICTGSTYIFNSDYKWYTTSNGSTTVSGSTTINAKTTYYIAKVGSEGCESPRTTYTINVNPIPSFSKNPTNKSICEGDSEDNLTTLSGVAVNNGSPVWYNAQTGGSKVNAADVVNGGTYWVAAENATTGCKNDTRKQFVLTVNPRPAAPTFDEIPAQCGSYTLPAEDKNQVSVNWYTAATGGEEIPSVTTTGIYYAEAVNANKCTSAERTPVQITINPKPTISISDNNSAVLYEDVELTAATDGTSISWEITEGDGSLSSTTGNSVTLTSSSAGNVTVTATATLGSCTATDTHEVEFSAENCADVTTTVEETVGKIKLLLSKPSWIGGSEKFYCYAWVNNTSTTLLGGWPGTELTQKEGDYYYVVVDANNKDIKIILNDNSEQTVDSDVLNANKIYQISATSSKNSDNKYTFNSKTDKGTYKESVTTTVPAPITAPAAKTISVSTTDGEGNIIFSGQVVKTGCDATNEYGFQYSSDGETWTTVKVGENAAPGTTISNNTVNGLDGTYYVRAYITNDNSTQYGAVTEITVSTKKYPITTVTLTHVRNQAGDPYSDQELANLTYCAGETVWFKLEQDGSKFQDYQWISWPGTDLRGMYAAGTFSFTITDSGNVGIRLKNDENDDWVESNLLEFKTHPVAISPTISFENATICSNSTATLKLGSLVVGQSYELYKEIENEGVYSEERVGDVTLTCNSIEDDLKFTGLNESGKYFVKGYTAQCPDYKASSQTATLEIVDESSVYITLDPTDATTTPWMPVKLTVAASDDYTLEVPEGVEFNQNGNICSVKIPLPQGSTGGEGQYDNVSFPQDATTSYTVTAKLVSTGGEDNPCAVPATATITLTPYVEDCTIGH